MKLPHSLYIISIGSMILWLCIVIFLAYPALQDIKKGSQEILASRVRVASVNDQSADLEKFKKNYLLYKDNLMSIDQLFINPEDPVNFIKSVELAAKNNGLTAEVSIVPSSNALAQQKQVAVFQISVNGGLLSIANFTKELERGSYLLKIKSAAITKAGKVNSKGEPVYGGFDGNFFIEAITK